MVSNGSFFATDKIITLEDNILELRVLCNMPQLRVDFVGFNSRQVTSKLFSSSVFGFDFPWTIQGP